MELLISIAFGKSLFSETNLNPWEKKLTMEFIANRTSIFILFGRIWRYSGRLTDQILSSLIAILLILTLITILHYLLRINVKFLWSITQSCMDKLRVFNFLYFISVRTRLFSWFSWLLNKVLRKSYTAILDGTNWLLKYWKIDITY